MHSPIRQQVLEHSVQVIALLRPIAAAVARHDRELGSQLRRAGSSVALNLAEAFGSGAGNQRLRLETALGSLYETRAALQVAVAWGYLAPAAAEPALSSLDRLGGRIYGLARH